MAKPVRHRGKWRIRWNDHAGGRKSDVFEKYNDAAAALAVHQAEAQEVRRGVRSAPPPEKTFVELADYWRANRAAVKRSGSHDESILQCHLLPAFGHLKLRDLGVEQVDRFVTAHAHLNKKTIANHLTLLIAMLNAAVDLGWLLKKPNIKKPRVRMFSADYHYLRTDDEITRFLGAARSEGELVFALYATAAFTGGREGELAALRWSDVDFEKRLITIQRSFEGPTKAEDVRYVPILDVLLPILRAWRLRCPGELLFPNRDGGMQGKSGRIFQEVLKRVLDAAGFPLLKFARGERHYIVFHDLRHTFASHWMMKSGDIFRLQKILGHKSMAMTQRYAHLAPAVFASDYSRFNAVTG